MSARVIPLFRSEPVVEAFDPERHISEELETSLHDVRLRIEDLWDCSTVEEFTAQVASIKSEVSTWPS